MSDEKLLESNGWTVECQSPFEIRHEDGSFATGQAADIVLSSIRSEFPTMKFPDLALGARFKYVGGKQVWIKLSDEKFGLVAEYHPEYIEHPRWVGQKICCFADTEEQVKSLDVILCE